jgi:hypothetical protein
MSPPKKHKAANRSIAGLMHNSVFACLLQVWQIVDAGLQCSFMVLFLHDFKGLVAFNYGLIFNSQGVKGIKCSIFAGNAHINRGWPLF